MLSIDFLFISLGRAAPTSLTSACVGFIRVYIHRHHHSSTKGESEGKCIKDRKFLGLLKLLKRSYRIYNLYSTQPFSFSFIPLEFRVFNGSVSLRKTWRPVVFFSLKNIWLGCEWFAAMLFGTAGMCECVYIFFLKRATIKLYMSRMAAAKI